MVYPNFAVASSVLPFNRDPRALLATAAACATQGAPPTCRASSSGKADRLGTVTQHVWGCNTSIYTTILYIYIYIISSTIVYPSTHLYMMIYRAQIFTKCSANASECVHSAPKSPELHPCLPWPIVLLRHPLLKLFVRVDAEARICVLWSAYNTCL